MDGQNSPERTCLFVLIRFANRNLDNSPRIIEHLENRHFGRNPKSGLDGRGPRWELRFRMAHIYGPAW